MTMNEYAKRTFPQLAEECGDDINSCKVWWQRLWEHAGPHCALFNFLNSFDAWDSDGMDKSYPSVGISLTSRDLQWPTVRAVIDWCLHHRHAKKVLVVNWSRWNESPDDLPSAVTSIDYRNRQLEERSMLTKFDFIIHLPYNQFDSDFWAPVKIVIDVTSGVIYSDEFPL